MTGDDDPGWLPALRPWWHFLVPFVPIWFRRGPLDLIGLRHLFVHSGVAVVELCIGVQWTLHDEPEPIPSIVWIAVPVLAVWQVAGMLWSDRRSLPASSAVELAGAFRARSFIQLGLALAPALWGIAGAQILDRTELSWIGTLGGVVLLAWIAPRTSRLDRVDEDLRAAGSTLSIRSALRHTAPTT